MFYIKYFHNGHDEDDTNSVHKRKISTKSKHSVLYLFHLKMLRDYLPAKPLHPSFKQREGRSAKINLTRFGTINIFYSDFGIFYYICVCQAF